MAAWAAGLTLEFIPISAISKEKVAVDALVLILSVLLLKATGAAKISPPNLSSDIPSTPKAKVFAVAIALAPPDKLGESGLMPAAAAIRLVKTLMP